MARSSTMKKMNVTRLNNSEYSFFIEQCIQYIEAADPQSIGLAGDFLYELQENFKKLIAVRSGSHASEYTVVLQELDTKRDDLLSHLFSSIRTACKLPIPDQSAAANSLAITTKSFRGMQNLPLNQKTEHISTLTQHLNEAEPLAHITLLGIAAVVSELVKVNNEYKTHFGKRNEETDVGNCGDIRLLVDEQYYHLIMMAGAAYLITPSDEATKFMENMNNLTKDTKTAYNQRHAQHKIPSSDARYESCESVE